MENEKYLIIGLGNPGLAYQETRHNIGFKIVQAFAKKNNWKFRDTPQFNAAFVQGIIHDKKVMLLLPLTYMNKSGEAVKSCMDYFQVSLEKALVVADDIYLPFGQFRLRKEGSAAGHNGLKSIESHLGSQEYSRLKVGIGDREHGELADYVLARFSSEEQQTLPSLIDWAVSILDLYISRGIEEAMKRANEVKKS